MKEQISRMRTFICDNGICNKKEDENNYRFPCCSGFLRPTDKLQAANQKLISTGEHIPLCEIEKYKSFGSRGGELIEYEKIKDVSLSGELFEYLFSRGKIGSQELSPEELEELYQDSSIINPNDTVIIYAQEFEEYLNCKKK